MLNLDLYINSALNENWVVPSLSMKDALNQRSSINFQYIKKDAVAPETHMLSELKADSDTIFKGTIDTVDETDSIDTPYVMDNIECVDFNQILDRRQVVKIYENKTFKEIVQDINTYFLDDEGITADTYVVTGPTFVKIIFDYVSVTEAFNYLSGLTGYFFYIDEDKELHFSDMSLAVHAPFDIGLTAANFVSMNKNQNRSDYRNIQYLKGGNQTLPIRVDSFVGDGKRRTFNIAFPFAEVPTVTVDSVAKTVGIKGVDTGKDWYWQKGSKELVQDDAADELINTNVLAVSYKGLLPIFIQAQFDDEITRVKTLEGGSGKYEMSESDEAIEDLMLATNKTQSILRKFAKKLTEVTFTTYNHGLHSGQVIQVYNANLGIDKLYLITEITARVIGYNTTDYFIEYTVNLADSEIYKMWQDFYINLLNATRSKMSIENQAITYVRYNSSTMIFEDTITFTSGGNYDPEWDTAEHDFCEFAGSPVIPDEKSIIYDEDADYAAGTQTDVVIANDKIILDTESNDDFTWKDDYDAGGLRSFYDSVQDNDYIYAVHYDTATDPQTSVEKIRKSDMTRVAYYQGSYLGARNIEIIGDYIYVCYYTSGKLVKFAKSDLSESASLAIPGAKLILKETDDTYLYVLLFSSNNSYQFLAKIRVSDFTNVGYKAGGYGDTYFTFMWQDSDYIYCNMTDDNRCRVIRFSKDLSARVSIILTSTTGFYSKGGGFCAGGYCYVAADSGSSTKIFKQDTSNWVNSVGEVVATYTGFDEPREFVYDGAKYAYLARQITPGKIKRILMSDYSSSDITLAANHGNTYGLSWSTNYLVAPSIGTGSYGYIDMISLKKYTYKASGTFDDLINLYITGDKVYGSKVTWTETLPAGTSIKVYGKINVGDAWEEITNGGSFLPDIIAKNISADPTNVYWKALLETTDDEATPEFLGIVFEIEGVPL